MIQNNARSWSCAPILLLLVAASASGQSIFFQGFETDISGWTHWTVFGPQFVPTRVASGTHGVISKAGNFHAEAKGPFSLDTTDGSASTDWGGYGAIPGCGGNSCAAPFPQNGYITSVDVYLDVSGSNPNQIYVNDTRFDFSSAINQADGSFERDFVFNGGYYNDTDLTGSGPRFVITASNNAGRGGAFPKNPARSPFTIATSGWYTLLHHFRDGGGGVLAVDLMVLDGTGAVLHTWTLSDPTDIIGSTVGGNRYGWFASQEFNFLAIDNSRRMSLIGPPTDKDQCKDGGWQMFTIPRLFKNQGDCVSFVETGK